LLDEPTNHLDLQMRHALSVALQGFKGAMVIVSHDRHLLKTVTDELIIVHDKKAERDRLKASQPQLCPKKSRDNKMLKDENSYSL